ncbi:hypothetical protein SBI_01194 [Streptomyces bingchenggensis BCW-1]|uniref:Uncharacterized protein n=1 Tax=Streptomyces bingchenggensis (strain BCW-1) TaxID=749414 RepID=D7C9Y7_STRBB|nr:hypothetical protein SBI_01194 [Streptomyces bingchenggensis BCW-1]
MAQHLIYDVAVGRSYLGTDLLDSAPDALCKELLDGEHSSSLELNNIVTANGSPQSA